MLQPANALEDRGRLLWIAHPKKKRESTKSKKKAGAAEVARQEEKGKRQGKRKIAPAPSTKERS